MREFIRILCYETKACLRQLSSAIRPNTVECILIAAFGILLSAALGYARLTTPAYAMLTPVMTALSLVIGLISFNKRNAQELISGEKAQALRSLPMEYRLIQFAKMEKLLTASFIIYAIVSLYILAAMLLSGSPASVIPHILTAMLAFSAGQSLRALMMVIGKRLGFAKYLLIGAAACCTAVLFRHKPDWRALLDAACTFYTANTLSILCALAAGTLLMKAARIPVRSDSTAGSGRNDMRGISARTAGLLGRFNSVTLRDIRGILHSAKDRRRFISGLITLPAITWVLALLMRLKVIPFDISGACTLWMLALLLGSGFSGIFEQQMTMGYEGSMILAYILSGSSVSVIQLKRLNGALMIAIPLSAAATLMTALLLGTGVADTLTAIAIAIAGCAALTSISAYYLIKGTSYFNEMNRPRMVSGIIRTVIKTLLDMVIMAPVALAEFVPMGRALSWIVWGYVAICAAAAIIYRRKLRKGDRYFYGEYQSIAA